MLKGSIALSKLERLASFVTGSEGDINYSLRFKKQRRDGRIRINGRVQAILAMTCQSCLEPVWLTIDETIALVVVQDETEAEELDSSQEPLIVQGDEVEPGAIFEDDLILALPMVARHANADGVSQCMDQLGYEPPAFDPGLEEKPNPFDVLSKLKLGDLEK